VEGIAFPLVDRGISVGVSPRVLKASAMTPTTLRLGIALLT
jgi:hypothetical protein